MLASWDNVIQEKGLEISFAGMAIVFSVLVLISLFLTALPRVLAVIGPYLPKGHSHGQSPSPAPSSAADDAVIAAIGFAMHHHSKQNDGKSTSTSSKNT